jgi:glycosyltransferase involved in cell wall biosynthesis
VASQEHRKIEGGRRILGLYPEIPPLVSVITAVYNGCETLERSIKSVVSQTFPRMEFIIIDGGSTDCSIKLLREYDNFIDYWVSEPDKGIYDALNKGIGLAIGEWLYFLGADDVIVNEDVFESIFSQQYDTKFLYGDVFYGNTGRIYGGEFSNLMLIKDNICQQGIFYNRGLFNILGNFDLKYQLVSDWVFNMKAFTYSGVNPTYINIVIAEYSLDGASSRIVDSAFSKDRLNLIYINMGLLCYLCAITSQLKCQIIANYKKHIVGTLSKMFSRRQRT